MNSNAFNWIHHLTEWTEQIFPQFKGSDWQTVAVRPDTIKADLYSLPPSAITISDVTLFDHRRQETLLNFTLFWKGLDAEWKAKVGEEKGGLEDGDTHKPWEPVLLPTNLWP